MNILNNAPNPISNINGSRRKSSCQSCFLRPETYRGCGQWGQVKQWPKGQRPQHHLGSSPRHTHESASTPDLCKETVGNRPRQTIRRTRQRLGSYLTRGRNSDRRVAAPKRRVAGPNENPLCVGGETLGHFRLPCLTHGLLTVPEWEAPIALAWLKCPITITNAPEYDLPARTQAKPTIISISVHFPASAPLPNAYWPLTRFKRCSLARSNLASSASCFFRNDKSS